MIDLILLAAEAPEELPKAPQAAYALVLVAGTAILLAWLIRYVRSGARDPLENAPVRRHRIPGWFAPVQVLIWMGVAAVLAFVASEVQIGQSKTTTEVISYTLLGFWNFVLVIVFLVVSYFGFARGFKGLGVRIRTVPADLVYGFLIFLASLPLIEFSLRVTMLIGQFAGFELETHPSLTSLGEFPQWWMQAIIVLFAVVVAPVFEELLFRGLFQSTLTGILEKPWVSILITSFIFCILHPPTHWLALFVLSVALGYSYEKSGSIFRPLFIHFYFNSASILLTLWSLNSSG